MSTKSSDKQTTGDAAPINSLSREAEATDGAVEAAADKHTASPASDTMRRRVASPARGGSSSKDSNGKNDDDGAGGTAAVPGSPRSSPRLAARAAGAATSKLATGKQDAGGGEGERRRSADPEPTGRETSCEGVEPCRAALAAGARSVSAPLHRHLTPCPDASGGTTLLVDVEADKKWKSWWRRVLWSFILVGAFNVLFFVAQQAGIMLLIVGVQAKIYHELVKLAYHYNWERQLPGFNTFYYYWFGVAAFFLYGRTIMPHLRGEWPAFAAWLVQHHALVSFSLYMGGIVAFVISLKKRKLYRYQFSQFAYCHMALLVVVGQSTLLAAIMFEGMLWFFLPVSLIVTNDCFAYIFGFFFGRTPLIRLSPKKTWEGFIGGFVVTVLYGFFATALLQKYPFMTCPRTGFDRIGLDYTCENPAADLLYVPRALESMVPLFLQPMLPAALASWQVSVMQLHAIVLAVFASLVAPFGGFFASGFKRAFKIKDFSDDIPGHGGFTDRMDCQILMGGFAYVYFQSIVRPMAVPLDVDLLATQIASLPLAGQHELANMLMESLGIVACAATGGVA